MLGLRTTLGRHAQPTGRLIARLKPMGMGKQKLATQLFLLARETMPVPFLPLASYDRAVNQDQSQAFIRDEIMTKVGVLGVAVWDCLLSGVSPSVLVGRVELGSPTLYQVKKVRALVQRIFSRSQ